MGPRRASPTTWLTAFTVVLGVMLACVLIGIGGINLVSPDVPSAYLALNTRVCVMLLLTAAVLVYALFRPLSGGIALSACGAVFVYLIPNPLAVPVLLVAMLSIIRGLIPRRSGPEIERVE